MPYKAQYDEDSGLASYDDDTSLAQVMFENIGETCSDCGIEDTPQFIKVTFDSITFVNNGTCYDCAGACKDQSWTGVFDPNDEYILEQVGSDTDACIWTLVWDNDATLTRWNSTDGTCSGGIDEVVTSTEASIVVIRSGSSVSCIFGLSTVDIGLYFNNSIDTTPDSGCVDGSYANGVSTLGLGCSPFPGVSCTLFTTMGHSGTMVIEAL